ncbi:MAG TPA: zf-HC2 domain-containing protein [Bryobacteraceae bacterium]|nr:zf-HC2 domain-containing protein [Bryobacteraceae bacterium]
MSSFEMRHPEEDALLRCLDGELSGRKARQVERHLGTCGQCRTELEELKGTIADCANYQAMLAANLPEPPQPWRDLYRDFSRIDESLANDSLLVRVTRSLVHSGAPRWAVAGVSALLVVMGVYYQLRQTPSVQAATLLKRAVAVAEAKPPAVRRHIRVRTGTQQFTRAVGPQVAMMPAAQTAALILLFQAAHYDWNDPLSARAFQTWRDAQPEKTDTVTKVSIPQLPAETCTRIRTEAVEGDLAAASITFTADLAPVEERLEFRDQEWVELTEIADPSTGSSGGSVAQSVEEPVRAAEPPSRSAALSPGPSASISDELQVLSALNLIGADLGDPVEEKLSNGKVVVTMYEGVPPDHQKAIQELATHMPNVEVRMEAQVAAPAPAAAASAPATNSGPAPIQSSVEKKLGSHAEFERFSGMVLDLDEQSMQRVYALRRLAQKFPPDSEAQLSSKDLDLLRELSRKHTAVLAEKVGAMEHILVPMLTSLGGTAANARPAVQHASWQPAAEDIYGASNRVHLLVTQMLGATVGDSAGANLPSNLQAALKDLQANLDDCRRLVK